ncbi:hypothetical protein PIB30_046606 [Stylosanthes scabra]|uniref:EF-hand domain-containing protein n=1 Tax=Stylosanthes scabra TaxID=79078 RepID=A0ABU6SGL0_9FABA|nr:hypothetical protein [Stylosanthes scabra]
MSVEIIDGTTITSFVEDEEAFSASVSDLFAQLDADKDGLLSYTEMRDTEEVARVYVSLFEQFDHDMNGSVDEDEFKKETKKMMLAMANGLGSMPVQMALEHDSLLLKAVQREYSYANSDNLLANAA